MQLRQAAFLSALTPAVTLCRCCHAAGWPRRHLPSALLICLHLRHPLQQALQIWRSCQSLLTPTCCSRVYDRFQCWGCAGISLHRTRSSAIATSRRRPHGKEDICVGAAETTRDYCAGHAPSRTSGPALLTAPRSAARRWPPEWWSPCLVPIPTRGRSAPPPAQTSAPHLHRARLQPGSICGGIEI